MWFFLPLLSFFQVADTAVTGQPPRTLEEMFERDTRETDIDRASFALLASFLTDNSRIRSAFLDDPFPRRAYRLSPLWGPLAFRRQEHPARGIGSGLEATGPDLG